jgi:hypothetical protein
MLKCIYDIFIGIFKKLWFSKTFLFFFDFVKELFLYLINIFLLVKLQSLY